MSWYYKVFVKKVTQALRIYYSCAVYLAFNIIAE